MLTSSPISGGQSVYFLTAISSHPLRYLTRALLHRGGLTRASHPTSVISEAQLTGITRLGNVAPTLLRTHPVSASADTKTRTNLFTTLPPLKMATVNWWPIAIRKITAERGLYSVSSVSSVVDPISSASSESSVVDPAFLSVPSVLRGSIHSQFTIQAGINAATCTESVGHVTLEGSVPPLETETLPTLEAPVPPANVTPALSP
jgi:hypothetical protein